MPFGTSREENHTDIALRKETRGYDGTCNCYICLTGRYRGHPRRKTNCGHNQGNYRKIIGSSNGLISVSSVSKLPAMKRSTRSSTIVKVCQKCFSEITRAKNHNELNKNVRNIAERLPEKEEERIATSIVLKKVQKVSSVKLKNIDVPITMQSRGHFQE
jgi:hypothetical protein